MQEQMRHGHGAQADKGRPNERAIPARPAEHEPRGQPDQSDRPHGQGREASDEFWPTFSEFPTESLKAPRRMPATEIDREAHQRARDGKEHHQ